jgi:tetratricopeptide (TPR) repeat protein
MHPRRRLRLPVHSVQKNPEQTSLIDWAKPSVTNRIPHDVSHRSPLLNRIDPCRLACSFICQSPRSFCAVFVVALLATVLCQPTWSQEARVEEGLLPTEFSALVELKTEKIQAYQNVADGSSPEAAAESLAEVVRVEMALLKMAENELGRTNVKLTNTYRTTAQDDGALLASQWYDLGEYAKSADVYKTVMGIARRRTDLPLEEFNDLLALTMRAIRLADASDEDIVRYQTAIADAEEARKLAEAQKFDKAADMLVESIGVQKEIAGVTPFLAGEYGRCAAWFQQSEKLDLAEQCFQNSLNGFDQTVGRETVRYASVLYNLALLLEKQKRFAEADELLTQARMIENRIGVDLKSQLMTLNELAGLYRITEEQSKYDQIVGAYRFLEARSTLGLEAVTPYLPVDAYAAVAMSPAAMMQAPELSHLPHEVVRSFIEQNLGIDPMQMETVVAFLTLPFDEAQANWGVLIKTVASQPLGISVPGEVEVVADGDLEYRRFSVNGNETACVASIQEGLIVVGNEASVQQVLAMAAATAKRGPRIGKLAGKMLGLHGEVSLLAAVDLEKMQVMLQAMMDEIPPVPDQFEPLINIPTRLDSLGAVVSLSEAPYFTLALAPRADTTAESISDLINESMKDGASLLIQQLDQLVRQDATFDEASLQQYMIRMVNTKLESMMSTVEDDQVVIRLDSAFEFQGPVLVGLLLPAIQAARDAATRMEGSNNLKMLGLAFWNYHDTYGHFPKRQMELENGREGLSWRVQLLPFLEESELYDQFHLDQPWDSEHNLTLVDRMPAVFSTPGLHLPPGQTNLVTLEGEGTAMEGDQKLSPAKFTDGLSNTLLVVEADADQAVIWTKPADLPFDFGNPTRGLGAARQNGFNGLLSDGSVSFFDINLLGDNFAERVKRMATRAGGEIIE